ncbi:MAG: hypothetical protein NTX01_05305 [Candidatus Omnitrophica bacterium]|nr:hypothetical protein [Candidatus Omnitrophota bacterium]
MKINKILILSLIVLILSVIALMIFVDNNPSKKEADIYDYAAERILYLISPLGRSEYNNLGTVDLNGIKVNLVTLKYKVLFVESAEKIYSGPENLLPYKIERTISKLWWKEYATEEYDQKKFTVIIKNFKGKKLVKEQVIKANGPIQNVILLLFYLRNSPGLKIGWNFTARILAEFKPEVVSTKLELVSIDKISVPAGKFQAYHFKSIPAKFEIWINKNTPQVPLKIKLKSIFDCSISMKEYSLGNN